MPSEIEPQTVYVDDTPTVWSPVQWELTEEERLQELQDQATASLLWSADMPEAVLRLFVEETEIARAHEPPEGYNPAAQGEWDPAYVTFQFARPIKLVKVQREEGYLYVEYKLGDLGYYGMEITPDGLTLKRL